MNVVGACLDEGAVSHTESLDGLAADFRKFVGLANEPDVAELVFEASEDLGATLIRDVATQGCRAKRIVDNVFLLEKLVENPPARLLFPRLRVTVQTDSRAFELLGDVSPAPSHGVWP
jgi:hypothetical protein